MTRLTNHEESMKTLALTLASTSGFLFIAASFAIRYKSGMNERRLEPQPRNNVLWHAILDCSDSVVAFCRCHDLPRSTVESYLYLKRDPYLSTGEPAPAALAVSIAAGIPLDELFPRALYSVEAIHLALSAVQDRTWPPAQQQGQFDRERRNMILNLLQTLSPREERVIKMRYGIGYDREHSLREVGELFGVSLERIRQIEMRALRHLCFARVSDHCRGLLNGNPSGDLSTSYSHAPVMAGSARCA
jgi:RNA polymerase sigma factor (sigma-70 family)